MLSLQRCFGLPTSSSSSSFSVFPAIFSWVHHFGEIFAYVTVFWSSHRDSHIQSLWMVHVGCVFDVGIHLSKTWMLGSFESVPWNACVHRLDLNLYSHLKEFHSKGKILCTRGLKQDRICDAASCRTASPTYYRLSYSGPGLPTDLTPFICHSVLLLVHLLSFILDKLLRLIGLMNLIFIWSHPIKMQDWKPFLCDFITKKRTFFFAKRHLHTFFYLNEMTETIELHILIPV